MALKQEKQFISVENLGWGERRTTNAALLIS
jgi:hypothetical protein